MEKEEVVETEWGGLIKNRTTGEYEVFVSTRISELVCRNHLKEIIKYRKMNNKKNPQYDFNDIKIMKRRVISIYSEWVKV